MRPRRKGKRAAYRFPCASWKEISVMRLFTKIRQLCGQDRAAVAMVTALLLTGVLA